MINGLTREVCRKRNAAAGFAGRFHHGWRRHLIVCRFRGFDLLEHQPQLRDIHFLRAATELDAQQPRDTMLDFIDHELMEDFTYQLRDRGMALRFGKKVETVTRSERGCEVTLEGGRKVRSQMLLFAAGRMGATASLGLEACGLEVDHRGRLKVNAETLQTSVPHIYAAGDVIGFPSLASTSMEQGRIAACHALGVAAHEPPEFFPYGIYAVPEISTVGMTEEEAAESVRRFRQHDARTLERQALVWRDAEAYRRTTIDASEALKQLFAEDARSGHDTTDERATRTRERPDEATE